MSLGTPAFYSDQRPCMPISSPCRGPAYCTCIIILIIPRSGGLHPANRARQHFTASDYTIESISMDNAKLLTLPDISEAFMKTADMLLLLDDGVAIPCHTQLLSMHSAVLCNMLTDLSSQSDEIVKVPLADFTEEQCSAVLAYLYANSVSGKGAAFQGHDAADHCCRCCALCTHL